MQEFSSRRRFLRKAAFAGGGALLGAAGLNQISPLIWRGPLMFEPNPSYWARSQPPQNPPLTDDIAVDVAVLGGGFTGLSAAYYIAASLRISVLSFWKPRCGNGASGRNGAMVLTMTAGPVYAFQLHSGHRPEDLRPDGREHPARCRSSVLRPASTASSRQMALCKFSDPRRYQAAKVLCAAGAIPGYASGVLGKAATG